MNGNGSNNGNVKIYASIISVAVAIILTTILANRDKPTRDEMERKDTAVEQRISARLTRIEREQARTNDKLDKLLERSH